MLVRTSIFFFLLLISPPTVHGKSWFSGPSPSNSPSPSPDSSPESSPSPSGKSKPKNSPDSSSPGTPPHSNDPSASTPADKNDANEIVKAQSDEKAVAAILPFRPLERRQQINAQVGYTNGGNRLIPDKYEPNRKENTIFKDLCFALISDELTVLSMYLGIFLHRKDETFIIIVLTLIQEMQKFKLIYNGQHKNSINKRCRRQRRPFRYLMRAWIKYDRKSDQDCDMNRDTIVQDAETLRKESTKWNDDRDFLEAILIRECIARGAAVIKEFEARVGKTIETVVDDNISNHDLVDAYSSLGIYVKDKYSYMAKILRDHSNGSDRWAVWIMLIGITQVTDWPKINDAFQTLNNNTVSLKDYILMNQEPDRVFLEMMAVMVDPSYKPLYLNKLQSPQP